MYVHISLEHDGAMSGSLGTLVRTCTRGRPGGNPRGAACSCGKSGGAVSALFLHCLCGPLPARPGRHPLEIHDLQMRPPG